MNRIVALDCTLRDGGYCNKWKFGENGIKRIVSSLIAAKLEVIECGFLTKKVEYNSDFSKFTDLSQLKNIIPQHSEKSQFVLMANYGEYDFNMLPERKDTVIDGIRVAFHKAKRYDALKACKILRDKGYDVYIQAMVSMLYSDEEFTELLALSNEVKPKAFYLVDSFGMMHKESVLHYFKMIEENLSDGIMIGFHSHNNLQLAYSNALTLIEAEASHSLIIDCSIYGMGRGAGNLNSELFLSELNSNFGKKYEIKPLLTMMDEVIGRFFEENPWGYSLPNYLSATHMIHPNYASYLSSKKTLTVEDIDEIFSMISPEKGNEYDEQFISDLYLQYMSTGVIRNGHLFEIKQKTKGKKILLVAPGKNAIEEKTIVEEFVKINNPIIISINHEYPILPSDYVFVSNIRRFKELDQKYYQKTISTSNIKSSETYASIDYFKLLNAVDPVRDNAGLMAIKFASEDLDATEIYLAGLDGYSHDAYANYETRDMAHTASEENFDEMNSGIQKVLKEFSQKVDIHFITKSLLET